MAETSEFKAVSKESSGGSDEGATLGILCAFWSLSKDRKYGVKGSTEGNGLSSFQPQIAPVTVGDCSSDGDGTCELLGIRHSLPPRTSDT